MPLLAAAAMEIELGSSVLVSKAVTGPGVYSSSITTVKSAANSGLIPGSGYICPYRSYSVSQSNISLVQFLNSKLAPYSVFLESPPPLVDCVYDLLCSGVLSPLVPFDDAPSFQTEEFLVSIEVTHWP